MWALRHLRAKLMPQGVLFGGERQSKWHHTDKERHTCLSFFIICLRIHHINYTRCRSLYIYTYNYIYNYIYTYTFFCGEKLYFTMSLQFVRDVSGLSESDHVRLWSSESRPWFVMFRDLLCLGVKITCHLWLLWKTRSGKVFRQELLCNGLWEFSLETGKFEGV